ncbi:hypothetical protein DFH08DRAFT_329618 [Mycena albidolilacea]|uniref:Uncharacterized protein n=1 Tax=Mycena albidolilacea TaxID=1033008 RepID=A0AAD7F1K5_9AGAR|nr:hypothetical protein DFH08DRAFT_329618 [Mycena albidolilacea]
MNCCSPARNAHRSILQLSVDELEGNSCGAQSEDLRVLRGRHSVRVEYLRRRQTGQAGLVARVIRLTTRTRLATRLGCSYLEKRRSAGRNTLRPPPMYRHGVGVSRGSTSSGRRRGSNTTTTIPLTLPLLLIYILTCVSLTGDGIKLIGGTFTLRNLSSPLAQTHTALARALRLATYTHLSLLLEQHFLRDSGVSLRFAPRPKPRLISPTAPHANAAIRTHNVGWEEEQDLPPRDPVLLLREEPEFGAAAAAAEERGVARLVGGRVSAVERRRGGEGAA